MMSLPGRIMKIFLSGTTAAYGSVTIVDQDVFVVKYFVVDFER